MCHTGGNYVRNGSTTDTPAGKRVWATGLGIAGESLVLLLPIVAPMVWPETLPNLQTPMVGLVAPVPPAPPPKGVAVKPRNQRAGPVFDASRLIQPAKIPVSISTLADPVA